MNMCAVHSKYLPEGMHELFMFVVAVVLVVVQSPPKGATIPYRPKPSPAGAHSVMQQQHPSAVSILILYSDIQYFNIYLALCTSF